MKLFANIVIACVSFSISVSRLQALFHVRKHLKLIPGVLQELYPYVVVLDTLWNSSPSTTGTLVDGACARHLELSSFSAHAHNSATEPQSVVPPYGTVYLRHCVLLTIICNFAGF